MNYKDINFILVLVLQATMMAALWGCSKEELTDGIAPGQYELSLTVTDGGYTSFDTHGSQTRVADDGYRTIFTPNDAIGLYAVDGNGSLVIKNAYVRLNEKNGELKWEAISGTLTARDAVRFFVYYPYSPSLTTVNPSATTADGFFADEIANWSLSYYQENTYTMNDLMVGMGTPGEPTDGVRPLAVRLAHKMALIVLSPPKTRYILSSDAQYTWIADDAYLAPDNYGSFYYMQDGTYRYLVKPGVETALSGTFVNGNGETRKFELTANIPAGGCKTFTIDGAKTTEKTYMIQTGDYYMNDGSLVSKDKTLSDKQKKACIGVVLKADKAADANLDDCNYTFKGTSTPMTAIHGYVLAVKDADYGNTAKWGTDAVASNVVTSDTDLSHFSGYKNTREIISYVTNNKLFLYSNANATYRATEDYERYVYASPAKTSGWFLPSAGQCKWWYDHRDVLLKSVEATENKDFDWAAGYWSSTEYDTSNAYRFKDSSVGYDLKAGKYKVRPCLVF